MRQINILYITVRSDFGGGPKHINQLSEILPKCYNLFMAYPEDGQPYGVKWNENNRIVDRINIPYRHFSLKTLFAIRKFVVRNGIQIVHSHGNGAGLYSRLLKLLLPSVKVIHTFHGISDNYSSCLKQLLNNFMGKFLAPLADLYIAVSNGEKKMALKKSFSTKNNTVVIYNGIPSSPKRTSVLISNPLKIVTLSRFDYAKNMDSMYHIAKMLKDDAIQFIWVGDGPDFARLKKQALEDELSIDFVGFSKEPYKYLLEADVYMSTSRFEGLPYGLIEAASMGLPIVATNVKGNNEVVLPGKTGFLFESELEAIEIVRKIAKSPQLYADMSNKSILFFKDNFTEDTMLAKMMVAYATIVR